MGKAVDIHIYSYCQQIQSSPVVLLNTENRPQQMQLLLLFSY